MFRKKYPVRYYRIIERNGEIDTDEMVIQGRREFDMHTLPRVGDVISIQHEKDGLFSVYYKVVAVTYNYDAMMDRSNYYVYSVTLKRQESRVDFICDVS